MAQFENIEIAEELLKYLGKRETNTRMYRQYGGESDYRSWFQAVNQVCGEASYVSPGGASIYAGVSRAGVHKAMKDGRLTAFLFHFIAPGVLRENAQAPYIHIPVFELESWAMALKKEADREAVKRDIYGEGDHDGRFLEAPKSWRKSVSKEKRKRAGRERKSEL